MKHYLFVVLTFSFHLKSNYVWANLPVSTEQILFEDLFQNYEPSIRPVYNHNHSLTIYFSLKINQMLELSEKDQVLGSNIVIEQVNLILFFKKK